MNTQKAIKEFLMGCNDEQGPIYKAAYKSYTRGQVEMQAYAMRVGIAHDIDPRILIDAEAEDRGRRLLATSAAIFNRLTANS